MTNTFITLFILLFSSSSFSKTYHYNNDPIFTEEAVKGGKILASAGRGIKDHRLGIFKAKNDCTEYLYIKFSSFKNTILPEGEHLIHLEGNNTKIEILVRSLPVKYEFNNKFYVFTKELDSNLYDFLRNNKYITVNLKYAGISNYLDVTKDAFVFDKFQEQYIGLNSKCQYDEGDVRFVEQNLENTNTLASL